MAGKSRRPMTASLNSLLLQSRTQLPRQVLVTLHLSAVVAAALDVVDAARLGVCVITCPAHCFAEAPTVDVAQSFSAIGKLRTLQVIKESSSLGLLSFC